MPAYPLLIGLDVDGVVADFIGPVLRHVSEHLGKELTEQDITRFELETLLGLEKWNHLRDHLLSKPGHAKGLQCYPGARESIDKLRQLGRVVFVTTPYVDSPTWSHDRTAWLIEHTGAKLTDVVHCWDKSLFGGDVLVDDSPHHLDAWSRSGRIAIRMQRPWNLGAGGHAARDLEDVVAIVQRLVKERNP